MAKGGARIGAGRKPKQRPVAKLKAGLPAPPAWLSASARVFYRRAGRILVAAGVMTPGDRDTLAMYAALQADIAALDRLMRAKDFTRTIVTEIGQKTHPIVTQHQQAIGRARMLAQDLGLTPASRGRVQVVTVPVTDDDQADRDAFFARPARPTLVRGGA